MLHTTFLRHKQNPITQPWRPYQLLLVLFPLHGNMVTKKPCKKARHIFTYTPRQSCRLHVVYVLFTMSYHREFRLQCKHCIFESKLLFCPALFVVLSLGFVTHFLFDATKAFNICSQCPHKLFFDPHVDGFGRIQGNEDFTIRFYFLGDMFEWAIVSIQRKKTCSAHLRFLLMRSVKSVKYGKWVHKFRF